MHADEYRDYALQAFLDALTEPAFLLDRQLLIRAANAALAQRLGGELSRMIGKPMFSFLPPPMAAQRRPHIERVFESGEPAVFEDSRAGRHFINHVKPVMRADGEVTAVAVFALDTTERRHAEQSLRDSEERFRRIVTVCLEGVWQIDHENLTTFVNEQMAAMLGYAVDEFIGRSIYHFMHDDDAAMAEANMERRRKGIAERHELRFMHKDGRPVWTMLSANPVHGPDGKYAGAVALISDVTERRDLERRMLQGQKLESLGVLAGGIAHDFNNLLVGILGNVGLTAHCVPPSSPALGPLREIEKAAEAAASLTKELLAYSGKGQFVVEPFDLNQVVSEVSTLLATVITKNARLELDYAPDLPLVDGDATQLRQVVMNLITNASDAIGAHGGEIRASTFVVRLDEARLAALHMGEELKEGDYVCVEVVDTGAGMDAATVARIFDPFFTTKFSGRGLGLAAVLGILRGHHAGLEIESALGRGSTFRVLLPAAEAASARPDRPVADLPAKWCGSGLVLVVDDEPTIRNVARQILQLSGFDVLTCEDGRAALATFREHAGSVGLVLLDMTMPGLSGLETLAELRRCDPNVCVVLTSGYTPDVLLGVDMGPPGSLHFLQKPYSFDQLVALVRRAFEARAAVAQHR